MTPHHLLVVDDDDRIRSLLKRYLVQQGYRVTAVADAAKARRMMATMDFDLAILDIMMPGEDGLSLLASMPDLGATPTMLLTARGDPDDRIAGLRLGADDYLAKPFEPEELALRIGVILRRSVDPTPPKEIFLSGMRFDPSRGELSSGDRRIRLTESESNLLEKLAETPGEPVSREDLAEATSAGLERAIDVQVTRLRRKIERDPRDPAHLQTVRGVGYRLLID